MKPSFALNLTHEGIGLLHRGRRGWLSVGEVALDDPDVAELMAWLRRTAAGLATGGVTTKLILPNSEILYDEVPAPGPGDSDREAQVRRGLEGRTPYSIDELAYDYVVSGGVARVAVVARETLAEAEAFAAEHRFNPVSFVAVPPSDAPPDWFSGEPLFGLTSIAHSLLDDDDPLEREDTPVRIVGQVNLMGIGNSSPVVEVSDSTPVSDVTTMQAMEAAAAARARQQAEAKAREKAEAEAKAQAEAEAREKAEAEAKAQAEAEAREKAEAEAKAQAEAEAREKAEAEAKAQAEAEAREKAEAEAKAQAEAEAREKAEAEAKAQAEAEAREKAEAEAKAQAEAEEEAEAERKVAAAAAVRKKLEAEAAAKEEVRSASQAQEIAEAEASAAAGAAETKTAERAEEDTTQAAVAKDTQDEAIEPIVDQPASPAPPSLFATLSGRNGQIEPADRTSPSLFATRRGRSGQIEPADPTPPEHVARRLEERNTRISSFLADEEEPAGNDLVEPDLAEPNFISEAPAEASRPLAPALASDDRHQDRMDAAAARVTHDPRDTYVPMVDDLEPAGLDAARTLYADAPDIRGKLPVGLMVTGGLLVVLLLAAAVGVYLTMGAEDDTAQVTQQAPEVTTASLEPAPVVTAPDQLPEADAVPETVVEPEPVEEPDPVAEPEPAVEPEPPAVEAALPPSDVPEEDVVSDGGTAAVDPPIPVPEPAIPTLLDAEATYAETGVWVRSPEPPVLAEIGVDDGIFLSALDPEIQAGDAVALPESQAEQDLRPITPLPPVAPGQVFEFDDDGLVVVPPEGAITPDGVQIRRGRPPQVPPERPASAGAAEAAEAEAAEAEAEEALALFRPRGRPENANEILERRRFGGYTLAELETKKPRQRPESEQALAAAEALADTDSDAAESPLAVASSRSPLLRPGNIAQIVAAARAAAPQQTQAVAAVARATPRIPTTASVARQATLTNAISLRRVNLIGVFGSPSNRRALVRLSSGRIIRVGVGDRVDGGRVAAIGQETLQYVKSGRNITLGLPDGS